MPTVGVGLTFIYFWFNILLFYSSFVLSPFILSNVQYFLKYPDIVCWNIFAEVYTLSPPSARKRSNELYFEPRFKDDCQPHGWEFEYSTKYKTGELSIENLWIPRNTRWPMGRPYSRMPSFALKSRERPVLNKVRIRHGYLVKFCWNSAWMELPCLRLWSPIINI